MPEIHHETARFAGRVQGVGFRYTALETAREFDVAGFVSNLPDGRVHLEAEGRPEEVEAFIAAVQERMHGFVRKVDRQAHVREAQFSGFFIR
ncbi:MAG TPA: acylphosphatase [Opitutaceae bacterium]|nr:acylphosphatase [Opitutaceae bacterium]